MVVWIAVGAIVLGVLILALTVLAVIGRIGPFLDAGRRLRQRGEQARGLETSLETLRQGLLSIQKGAADVAQRMARLRGQ